MLDGQRTMAHWREVVSEVESLSEGEWRRVQGHGDYRAYVDHYLTAKCLTDFWWHLRYGVYFGAWKHYDPCIHRRVAYWLQDWARDRHGSRELVKMKALIMSRELCKTQVLIAYDAWRFAQDPNLRMIIRSYNLDLASQISNALMKMLKSEKFRRRYPWIRPALRGGSAQEERWTPKEFMLERDEADVRVPSCQAMGVEGVPTGSHFHLGHYDDFEVLDNAKSESGREEMFSVFRNDDNLFVAGSQRNLAGTPWDPKALIQGIMSRTNGMEDHELDVFRQPCTVEVFDRPFTGHDPRLLGDRVTVHAAGAGWPTATEDLVTCMATVRFFRPDLGDYIEEVREVVWNDGSHFRVNRPFGQILGQPVSYTVGTEKPASPIRYTLDSVDWVPELRAELPPVVSSHAAVPGVGALNPRSSLPEKLRMQGSLIFNAQMRLMSTDEKALVLHSEDVQVISWDDVPPGVRRWRRSSDFASAKATVAATSMSTGFELEPAPGGTPGFYLTHIAYEPQMGTTWKLLEMVWGPRRVAAQGGRLMFTTFEKSGHIEDTIKDLLPDVCRDPYAYFSRMPGSPGPGLPSFAEIADQWFSPGEAVPVPLKWLPRTLSKNDRIAKQQPVWQGRKLFILEDCAHRETLLGQADRFTMASEEPFDLLDNLTDLLNEGRLLAPVARARKKVGGESDWKKMMQGARDDMATAAGAAGAPGWPA